MIQGDSWDELCVSRRHQDEILFVQQKSLSKTKMCLHCNLTLSVRYWRRKGGKKTFLRVDQAQRSQYGSHLTCQQSITTISLLMLAKYCHLQSLFMGGRWKSWHFAMWLSNTSLKKAQGLRPALEIAFHTIIYSRQKCQSQRGNPYTPTKTQTAVL